MDLQDKDEPFTLQNPTRKPTEPPLFEPLPKGRQLKMLTGLDCPAGTVDLFPDFVT
jgi:hypothetical protein